MELLPLADGLPGFLVDGLHAGHFSLVVKFAAFCQRQFAFEPAILKVDPEGNQCQSFFDGLSNESTNLTSIQQKFTRAQGIVVGKIPMRVGTDMTVQQPDFAGLHQPVGVFKIHSPVAGRFDLRSRQDDAGFKLFEDFVVMKRLPVYRNVLTHYLG